MNIFKSFYLLESLYYIIVTGIISIIYMSKKEDAFDDRQSDVKIIGLFVVMYALILSTYLVYNFDPTTTGFLHHLSYKLSIGGFNINCAFGLDGLSVFFVFLSALLMFLCTLFIWDEKKFKEYLLYLLLIELFLFIIFTVLDLLFFYMFFEAILVPMFLLIGIWGSRARKIRAVYLFFFYTLCSSLLMLISILYIYNKVGSLSLEHLMAVEFTFNEQILLWITFFLSFASKIPMFPFHIWLPEAHVEAPTVGSVLLAGILLKLGVYGFIRFSLTLFPEASFFFSPLIYLLSIIGILFASLAALRQTDIKRIIAYSSIAHMNLVTLGIFSFNVIGLEGSIAQSISHGFVAGGLFFLIGILYSRYHSRFLYYYGGLVHFMPIYAITFLIFTLANIALPGTSSFVGEFLLLLGIYKTSTITAIIAALGVILSGAYSLWLYNRMMFGNIKSHYTLKYADMNKREFFVMLPLFFFIFFMGIFPNYFLFYLQPISNYLYIL